MSGLRTFMRLLCLLVSQLALAGASQADAQITATDLLRGAVPEMRPEFDPAQDAIDLFRQGDLQASRTQLQELEQQQPQLAPADVMYAKLAIALGRLDVGRAALEQAVIDDPDDPEAYIILGNLAFREQRLTYAQLSFSYAGLVLERYERNSLRKQDMEARITAGKAAVAEARRQWKTALTHLQSLIELDPKSADAHRRLAICQFNLKQYDEAIESFRQAHRLNQRLALPEISMGLLYTAIGEIDQARQLMQAAVEVADKDPLTLLAASNWALGIGDLELARSTAEAAVNLDEASLAARLALATVARIDGKLDEAERLLTAVHMDDPNNFSAINQLALTLIAGEDETAHRKALAYAQLNSRAHSDRRQASGREAAVTMAWILFRLGHEAEADKELNSIINAGTLSDESAYYAARIFHARGNTDTAKAILARALARSAAFAHRDDAEKLFAEMEG